MTFVSHFERHSVPSHDSRGSRVHENARELERRRVILRPGEKDQSKFGFHLPRQAVVSRPSEGGHILFLRQILDCNNRREEWMGERALRSTIKFVLFLDLEFTAKTRGTSSPLFFDAFLLGFCSQSHHRHKESQQQETIIDWSLPFFQEWHSSEAFLEVTLSCS